MSASSAPRVLVVGPDKARLAAAVRRLEGFGFRCDPVQMSAVAMRGGSLSQPDVIVALEIGGSWQPTIRLLEGRVPTAGSGLSGPPVLVIAEGVEDQQRTEALDSERSGVWDWVDASRPDQEIAARVRRLAGMRRLALEAEDLRRRCAELDSVDRVTGLPDHKALQEYLAREFRRAERYGHALSLVLVDIDRFGSLNEAHGHRWGDRLLGDVSRRLRSLVREIDMVSRFAGQQFALLLPETDAVGAMGVAERARSCFEEVGETIGSVGPTPGYAGEGRVRVTASLGVATFPEEGIATRSLLIRAAETALRRAKDEGRNRAVAHRQRREAAGATGATGGDPGRDPVT